MVLRYHESLTRYDLVNPILGHSTYIERGAAVTNQKGKEMNERTGMSAFLRKLRAKPQDNRWARAKLKPPPGLPAAELPPEWRDVFEDMQDRLTEFESRNARGRLGRLFGMGSVAVLLLGFFLIGGAAWAYTGFGSGIKSCESWVAAKDEHYAVTKRARFHGWTSGYLTAYSLWVERGSGPVSRHKSAKGAWAWIDYYCEENPGESVAVAAEQLILSLKDN